MWDDPSKIDLGMESRAVTFENPTGAKGAGGTAHGGRKGAPKRLFLAGRRWCWRIWKGRVRCATSG